MKRCFIALHRDSWAYTEATETKSVRGLFQIHTKQSKVKLWHLWFMMIYITMIGDWYKVVLCLLFLYVKVLDSMGRTESKSGRVTSRFTPKNSKFQFPNDDVFTFLPSSRFLYDQPVLCLFFGDRNPPNTFPPTFSKSLTLIKWNIQSILFGFFLQIAIVNSTITLLPNLISFASRKWHRR